MSKTEIKALPLRFFIVLSLSLSFPLRLSIWILIPNYSTPIHDKFGLQKQKRTKSQPIQRERRSETN